MIDGGGRVSNQGTGVGLKPENGYDDFMTRAPFHLGNGFVNNHFPLSRLDECFEEDEEGNEEEVEQQSTSTFWNKTENGYLNSSSCHRSANEQLPGRVSFVTLADMNPTFEKLKSVTLSQKHIQRIGTSCQFDMSITPRCRVYWKMKEGLCPDEQVLIDNQPDMDAVVCENQDEETVAMIEETQLGDEYAINNESSWNMDCSTVLRVKTLHISSPILLQEEAAVMELLNFMYSNSLSSTRAPALLDVLMAADKFEVASLMRYCSRLLCNLPMTPESAMLYLNLPSSVLMGEAVQPLIDAAKQYLACRCKDITK
ncbi:BTB/POZ domain-containing protein [Hibiscus syriacus]|uniref:BTB/POZ domain-containing protein n=1 Tax=Hibiscus syriacus TaxID=106335 RepID=A0A6A2X6N4_HIBSY|nr:BTB/POZ domain-containing protein [Hibiscus syriacus]